MTNARAGSFSTACYDTILGYRTDTIGVVPFSVVAAPVKAVAAPVNRPLALTLMMSFMTIIAVCKLRAPQDGSRFNESGRVGA